MWWIVLVLVLMPRLVAAGPVELVDCQAVTLLDEGCQADETQASPRPAAVPLFPKETVAPSTPPLFYKGLHTLSLDDARQYLAWQQARLARLKQWQALIEQAATEQGQGAPVKVPYVPAP